MKQRYLPKKLALLNRMYALLLLAYPAEFRREYGREMRQVVKDSCYDSYSQNGYRGMFRLWGRFFFDLIKSVSLEYLEILFMKKAIWIRVIMVLGMGTLLGLICGVSYAYLTAICCLTASIFYIGSLGAILALFVSTVIVSKPFLWSSIQALLQNGRIIFFGSVLGAIAGIFFEILLSFGDSSKGALLYYGIGGMVIGALLSLILVKAPVLFRPNSSMRLADSE